MGSAETARFGGSLLALEPICRLDPAHGLHNLDKSSTFERRVARREPSCERTPDPHADIRIADGLRSHGALGTVRETVFAIL
ncbi:hypothetical protein HRbin30_00977 [bacterium HR30]|nr:hypothetical protein HRbin30_00977 [bacterium HR30]